MPLPCSRLAEVTLRMAVLARNGTEMKRGTAGATKATERTEIGTGTGAAGQTRTEGGRTAILATTDTATGDLLC